MSRVAILLGLIFSTLSLACNLRANADCATISSSSNSASGVTKCGTDSCQAGTYCSNPSGNVCANGCKADDNCGENEHCDLSNAKTDLGGNKVGQCAVGQIGSSSVCGDAGPSIDGGDAGDAGSPKDAGRD